MTFDSYWWNHYKSYLAETYLNQYGDVTMNSVTRLTLPIVMAIAISSCSSEETSTTSTVSLVGSWAGDCVSATQGSQRPIIAFSAGRFSVRTFLYLATSTCSGTPARSTDATTGDYSDVGTSGLETEVDITNLRFNDTREQARHEAVIPRSFDVYYIENDLLFYGDYASFDGSSESERPVTYGTPSVATYLGSDTTGVF